jgi:uroporphyrinogen-III synthase
MQPPRLLITRAEPEASLSAAQVTRLGGSAILAPIRRGIAISTPAPPRPDGVVATSVRALQNAESVPADWRTLPCFVVGDVTGDAAREAGFRDIRIARGDAVSLAPLLAEFSGRTLVYLTGEPRRPELEEEAARRGTHLVLWLRYRMEEVEILPETARAALTEGSCDAILHFSHESSMSLLRLVRQAELWEALQHPVHACLSQAIAESLARKLAGSLPAARFAITPERNAEALIRTAFAACRHAGMPGKRETD